MAHTEFVDLAHARTADGVRMIVSVAPSPWSLAARAVFRLAGVPVLLVRETRAETPEIAKWVGIDNAPVVVHGEPPVRASWAAIVALAARLGRPGSVLPADLAARADVMGALELVAGEDGLGWNVRLQMIDASIESGGTRGFPLPVGEYLARRYGYVRDAMPAARARAGAQIAYLHDRLAAQRARGDEYFAGDAPGALDAYVAGFSVVLAPITDAVCPKASPMFRAAFGVIAETFGHLVTPELAAHGARMYERHLEWPIAL